MSFVNVLIVAFGVSADAFAVSLAQGVRVRRRIHRDALLIAVVFGVFQAVMPLLGWLLGAQLADVIEPVDHWIAFALLVAIGGKMLWEALRPAGDEPKTSRVSIRQLLMLAVATSIDAFAVGLGFAFLHVEILPAILLIGVVTAALAYGGVLIGHRVGTRWQTPAEVVGGLVLIGIGTKILFEHLLA